MFGGTDDGKLIRWNMDTKEETVIFKFRQQYHIMPLPSIQPDHVLPLWIKTEPCGLPMPRTNSISESDSAHSARILDVKFSPDDRQIATSSMDKTVKIWDANNLTNRPIIINKHNAWVLSVAFSPDGKYLVSSSERWMTIFITGPPMRHYMADQMCGKVSRNLTQREWETYVSYDIPYQKTCPNK